MNSNLNRHHRRRAKALGMTADEYLKALDEQDDEGSALPPEDPDYITVKESCAVVGGSKPISPPSFYRDPELKALIEHPTPRTSRIRRPKLIGLLNARARRDASNGGS